jgi:hypothetical protein
MGAGASSHGEGKNSSTQNGKKMDFEGKPLDASDIKVRMLAFSS